MPLYEYLCKKCGHVFEKIVKFSDRPTKKCPECGGAVEQTISAPAVQFKGSGWYVTDYAKKSQSSSSSSDGGKDSKEPKDSKDSKDSKKDEKKSGTSKESTSKKVEKSK
jgi:putative FmdB family regulatory protein